MESNNAANLSRIKAIFCLISRNMRKSVHNVTDEELLQEILDEFKDKYKLDLENMNNRSRKKDYNFKYPQFVKKVAEKAESFK